MTEPPSQRTKCRSTRDRDHPYLARNWKFESIPLQQRVHELSVTPLAPRLRGPDITRPDLESEYHPAGRLDKRHPEGPDHRPAALGEEIFDVSVAERETQVDLHGMLDDNRPTLY